MAVILVLQNTKINKRLHTFTGNAIVYDAHGSSQWLRLAAAMRTTLMHAFRYVVYNYSSSPPMGIWSK